MFCFIREILISLYGITLNLEFEQGRGHKIWREKKLIILNMEFESDFRSPVE